jgi:5-methylcytosine-specific restriction endonuclease McrA
MLRGCLSCGTPHFPSQRCPNPACSRHRYQPSRPAQPERSHTERKRRKAVVDAWIAEHGHVCPGFGVPPHPSHYLQADHVRPTSLGGDPGGELGVLCRECNVRKGGRNRIRFPSRRSR